MFGVNVLCLTERENGKEYVPTLTKTWMTAMEVEKMKTQVKKTALSNGHRKTI